MAQLTEEEKRQFHGDSVLCVCSRCLGNEDECAQARCTTHRSEQDIATLEAEDKEKKEQLDPLDATYSVSVTREQVEADRKRKKRLAVPAVLVPAASASEAEGCRIAQIQIANQIVVGMMAT